MQVKTFQHKVFVILIKTNFYSKVRVLFIILLRIILLLVTNNNWTIASKVSMFFVKSFFSNSSDVADYHGCVTCYKHVNKSNNLEKN